MDATLNSKIQNAKWALSAVRGIVAEIKPPMEPPTPRNNFLKKGLETKIRNELLSISEQLANSYLQIKMDLATPSRISWAGTAHELREIVTNLLRIKAPEDEVKACPWYVLEKGTNGPTHKQRVRYILEQHNKGSKEYELAAEVYELIDQTGRIVRASYTRACDAAHRRKGQQEVSRLLEYFEVFVQDLLNI